MAERALKSIPAARDEAPNVREPGVRELPPAAPSAEVRDSSDRKNAPRFDRGRLLRWGLFGLLPLALLVGGYFYVTGGQVMTTDDAYVDAEKVGISTDVSGIVQDVDVTDNDHVTAGQILYRLDPRQFQIALDNAKANMAQTALSIDAMKQDYQHMLSDASAQQAQVDLDQTNYNRAEMLLHSGTATQAAFDQAQYTLLNDKSKLESLRQQAATQLARLGGNPEAPTTQQPQYLQAQAQVEEAQRQLDHTVIKAPFSGTVTSVPSIAPGKYLAASTTAFYLVDNDHVWVSANPKETELTYVHPGQQVLVTVDAYPDSVWRGAVESVSPAASQEFSLLPAQNTSGNWVKVVQRVPMRVRVDVNDKDNPPLRAGMSAIVDVDTGHARGFPRIFGW
ncbi:MAG: HlyD family secretion protein [Xanthobacteraceae bacterium]|jgi:membrane fusion protein (multidrug efflux system)